MHTSMNWEDCECLECALRRDSHANGKIRKSAALESLDEAIDMAKRFTAYLEQVRKDRAKIHPQYFSASEERHSKHHLEQFRQFLFGPDANGLGLDPEWLYYDPSAIYRLTDESR